MNKPFFFTCLVCMLSLLSSSCTTVREGQAGVKRRFGTYKDKPYTSGLKFFNPFTSSIVKVSTQTSQSNNAKIIMGGAGQIPMVFTPSELNSISTQ